MNRKSKRAPLLFLAITSIVCSKLLFLSFNDPEGANLLIVMTLALVVYLLSSLVYSRSSLIGFKKILLAVFVQVLIVTILYFFLR